MARTPVLMRAELRHCEWDSRDYMRDMENHVEEFHIWHESRDLDFIPDPEWREKMRQRHSPANYVADVIAGTRNIAPTWDIVSVTLDGVDVTEVVQAAWNRWYVRRRSEFLNW